VGHKTNIIEDEQLLPMVCRPLSVTLWPNQPCDWNPSPFDAHFNISQWLALHRDDFRNIVNRWQYVNVDTNQHEYPRNPLQDTVQPLPQFVAFWEYYLSDNR
jgi:hypothetical protein